MVKAIQAVVFGVIFLLGTGMIAGGILGPAFIDDQLNQGIKDILVTPSDYEESDPEGYEDWLTTEDSGDVPKYKKYYFWNLTNADAYLTGANPIMEEIGPYAFRQYDIKFNVEFTTDTVSYQTYTYYVFDSTESFSGASLSDKIININPAYMGVIADAGSEANLVTSFVGPTMATILDGLQTDFTDGVIAQGLAQAMFTISTSLSTDFVDNVKVQGAAQALDTIIEGFKTDFVQQILIQGMSSVLLEVQDVVTENFQFAVNATTAAGALAYDWTTTLTTDFGGNATKANLAFFNNITYAATTSANFPGVGEYLPADLGYTNYSITQFLWNTTGVIPGWFTDLNQGTGILEYLGAYNDAVTDEIYFDNATLQALYGASQIQLDVAAGYLQALLTDNALLEGVFQTTYPGETTQTRAESMFYSQWVNGSVISVGLDINDDGSVPDGFELLLTGNLAINQTIAEILFNDEHPLGLTNDTGIFYWFDAAKHADVTNATLMGSFGLNATELGVIYSWLPVFKDGIATAGIIGQFALLGVTTTDDIGYAHWGTNLIAGGLSTSDVQALPGIPEFWAWADRIGPGLYTFDLTTVKELFIGTYNLTDTVSVGTFLTLGQQAVTGNATALAFLNALFGLTDDLTTSEVGLLLTYIDYLLNTFVAAELPVPFTDLAYFHWVDSAVTGGLSVYDIDPSIGGFIELWAWATRVASTTTTVSFTNSKNLFTGTYNLTETNSMGTFLVLGQQAAGANATALATMNALFDTTLSQAETGQILFYLDYILNTLVLPVFGVSITEEIAFAHWASPAITGGLTLDVLSPEAELPTAPEFWAATGVNLTLSNAVNLLNGTYNLLDTDSVAIILLSASAILTGDTETLSGVNTLFGTTLTIPEYSALVTYIQETIMQTFILETVLAPVFAAGGGIISTRTIDQWLWEYDDPLLVFLEANAVPGLDTDNALFTNHTSVDDPRISEADIFNTGAEDIDLIGQYEAWHGQTQIENIWKITVNINGTDATQFHPGVEKDEELHAFVSDLQRVVTLAYLEDRTFQGVDLLRFVLKNSTLDPNADYYQNTRGLANMTSSIGAPLFLSKPHFLDAASSVLTGISGLNPNSTIHDTFIDIEPISGTSMSARKRLQINFNVAAGDLITTGIAGNKYIPLVWVEEGGDITQELSEDFSSTVYGALNMKELLQFGTIPGLIVFAAGVTGVVYLISRKSS